LTLTLALALTLSLALTLALTLTLAALLTATGRTALATFAFAVRTAAARGAAAVLVAVRTIAAGAAASTALTRNDSLLVPNTPIENAQRSIEFTVDLRSALAGSHATAAALLTAALRSCAAPTATGTARRGMTARTAARVAAARIG
jgi:hypothetical protein